MKPDDIISSNNDNDLDISHNTAPSPATIILAVSIPMLVIAGLIFGYEYFKKRRRRRILTWADDESEFFPSDNDNGCDSGVCEDHCDESCVDYLDHYNQRMEDTFGIRMSVDESYESGFRGMYEV